MKHRICTATLAALALTVAVSALGQQPPPDGPPSPGGDVRRFDDPPPRGGPGGPRRPGDVRGRGGPMPPPAGASGYPSRGEGGYPGSEYPGRVPRSRRDGPPGPGMGPGPYEMQRLEQDDPEMYKLVVEDARLDREAIAMARRVLQAKSPEREKLEGELAVLVNKHFDVRQQRRELSLKRMEEELKRLREAIEERTKGRDEIVEKRIAELVGSDSTLEF